MSFCGNCGSKLKLARQLFGRRYCTDCEKRRAREQAERLEEEARAREAARADYRSLLGQLGTPDVSVTALVETATEKLPLAAFSDAELKVINQQAVRDFANSALADDILSVEEEERWNVVTDALGVSGEVIASEMRDVFYRLIVAQANDQRLLELTDSEIILKRGEVLHFRTNAALTKEVAIREYQGGYSGVSFRIMKGVRYHVGGTRGRSVVVGTQLQIADTGTLHLTSQRAVFVGQRQSLELPYTKLLTLNVFTDGVQFHQSNRKSAPLFQVESGDAVAAIVNTAAQRVLG